MVTSGDVRTVVVDRLADRAAAWDALVASAPLPSPFLRSWWLDAATRAAHHLLVLDGEALVGGLPLSRDRLLGVPRFRFAAQGVLCPDHLDLVALPGREDDVSAAVHAWFTSPGSRIVDLAGLPDRSLVAAALGGAVRTIDVAPYHPLPERGEDYLAGRSSNFRRSVRKADRRLAEDGVTHRRVTPEALPRALEDFRSLHGDRDGRGPLLAELPVLASALSAGVAAGEARVDVLEGPAGPVAVSVGFVVERRLSLYQVARSLEREHRSAATALLHRVVVDAADGGCREVDLLRGGEDYKSSFADHRREVGRLRVGHGLRARALVAAWALAARARPRVGRLAHRARALAASVRR